MSASRSSTAARASPTDATALLELVEGDGVARLGLCPPKLRAIERVRDAIQNLDHVTRIGVNLVEGGRKQGTGDRARLHVRALGQPSELLGVLVVKCDVQTLHDLDGTRKDTPRAACIPA
jgi:hypothetical protein